MCYSITGYAHVFKYSGMASFLLLPPIWPVYVRNSGILLGLVFFVLTVMFGKGV